MDHGGIRREAWGIDLLRYGIIVVDPPWEIKKIKKVVRPNQVDMDYPMLSLEEIYNLRIRNLAATKAMCFLWTVE